MNGWISVKDQLPRVRKNGFSKYVLTYGGGFAFVSARIRDGQWRTTMENPAGRVTHWRPLPDIPVEALDEKGK